MVIPDLVDLVYVHYHAKTKGCVVEIETVWSTETEHLPAGTGGIVT